MPHQSVGDAFPYPLNVIHTPGDVQPSADTFEQMRTLLEQSTGLARVLALVAASGEILEQEMPAYLEVLHGYCATALAQVECWEEVWQVQREDSEAQRHTGGSSPCQQT
jgi:hypothetical protein